MSEKATNSSPPPAPPTPPPLPPRPAAAPPPPPPPSPPPRPASAPANKSRRGFLTLLAVVGSILTLVPWIPNMGSFLSSSAAVVAGQTSGNYTIVLDQNTDNGGASGKKVNVNDLGSFPPNSTWVMTYPSSGDPSIDGQNSNTFVKWALIRLPKELGGANKTASDFVAFSKVCVHLWCSPNYNPTQSVDSGENGYMAGQPTHELYECPCHGSGYSVGLGQNGVGKQPVGLALIGPAAVQPAP